MTREHDDVALPPGLQLYWYEDTEELTVEDHWVRLLGGMNRLLVLRSDFESLSSTRDITRRLIRLGDLMESFLLRSYELRERIDGLAARVLGVSKGMYKSSKDRASLRVQLREGRPELAAAIEALLPLIEDDVRLRNRMTHEFYLALGYSTGHDIFDALDMLTDAQGRRDALPRMTKLLRAEIKKSAIDHCTKITKLIRAIDAVSDECAPASHRRFRRRATNDQAP